MFMLASAKKTQDHCLVPASNFNRRCHTTCMTWWGGVTCPQHSVSTRKADRAISLHKQESHFHLEKKVDGKKHSCYILISSVFICLLASLHNMNCSKEN